VSACGAAVGHRTHQPPATTRQGRSPDPRDPSTRGIRLVAGPANSVLGVAVARHGPTRTATTTRSHIVIR